MTAHRLLALAAIVVELVALLTSPLKVDASSMAAWSTTDANAVDQPHPVVAAAGDIACDPADPGFANGNGTPSRCHQMATSDLLLEGGYTAVLALGDNQYECSGYDALVQSYDPSWGRLKAITYPVVGNHEYLTTGGTGCIAENSGASGYFRYFGDAAGALSKGYYSFDLGSWHLIALNSNCASVGGCDKDSPQGRWLKDDLAAHPSFCQLAYWHIPLFSSGAYANHNSDYFWQALYEASADVVLVGHDHIYERFAPQSPTGIYDPQNGIRQFTVGTGGGGHTPIGRPARNSEVRNADTYGILELGLLQFSYEWRFVPEAGQSFTDSGTALCHTDRTPPSEPTNLSTALMSPTQIDLTWTASTDNVKAVSYEVYRDGASIGVTSTAYISDASVRPGATYRYHVVARDAAGNASAPSAALPVAVPTKTTTRILRFSPDADASVRSDQPGSNFGADPGVEVDQSPGRDALLRFVVSGIGDAKVKSAKLRLYCVNQSAGGGDVLRVADDRWDEHTVTWNSAPVGDLTRSAKGSAARRGEWYEIDLSSLVTGDGTYSLKLIGTSTDGAVYNSKEGLTGFGPELAVTTR